MIEPDPGVNLTCCVGDRGRNLISLERDDLDDIRLRWPDDLHAFSNGEASAGFAANEQDDWDQAE